MLTRSQGDECIAHLESAGCAQDDPEVVKAVKWAREFESPLVEIANTWKATLDAEFKVDLETSELPALDSVGGESTCFLWL